MAFAAWFTAGSWRGTLSSVGLPHFVPTAGVRLTAEGVAVAFTGDSGPSDDLIDLSRHVDLYVAEATDLTQQGVYAETPARAAALSTSTLAGQIARRAGARRLMLTHFWPGNNREVSRRQAAAGFGGSVLLAKEGLVVETARLAA